MQKKLHANQHRHKNVHLGNKKPPQNTTKSHHRYTIEKRGREKTRNSVRK